MPRTSAGLLLYRRGAAAVEVLVGHMGGPFWARKHAGAWAGGPDAAEGASHRRSGGRRPPGLLWCGQAMERTLDRSGSGWLLAAASVSTTARRNSPPCSFTSRDASVAR